MISVAYGLPARVVVECAVDRLNAGDELGRTLAGWVSAGTRDVWL